MKERISGRVASPSGHSGSAPSSSVSASGECPSRSAKAGNVSEPQQAALRKLADHGGEGVIDKSGRVVASGVRLMGFDAVTWLRLMTTGHVEPRGDLRLGLTSEGQREAASRPAVKVDPHRIYGNDYQGPARLPGAE